MSAVTRRRVIQLKKISLVLSSKAYASLPEQKVIKVLLLSESILYKLYSVVYFSIILFCFVFFFGESSFQYFFSCQFGNKFVKQEAAVAFID